MELLLLAETAHRAGAARLTAVIPYFGCARRDRRVSRQEVVGPNWSSTCPKAAGCYNERSLDELLEHT